LFEIGRNLRADLARRRSTDELTDDRGVVDPRTHDPGQNVYYEERTRQVEQCFQHLSEREKCVFGQILQGQAYADIRTLCACNANEAHKATHSARQKLRICLEKGAI